jgi:hypothetical protein
VRVESDGTVHGGLAMGSGEECGETAELWDDEKED